jgi:hypothetical protein
VGETATWSIDPELPAEDPVLELYPGVDLAYAASIYGLFRRRQGADSLDSVRVAEIAGERAAGAGVRERECPGSDGGCDAAHAGMMRQEASRVNRFLLTYST